MNCIWLLRSCRKRSIFISNSGSEFLDPTLPFLLKWYSRLLQVFYNRSRLISFLSRGASDLSPVTLTIHTAQCCSEHFIENTPGTRGWSRLLHWTLAVPKKRAKISFFSKKNKNYLKFFFLHISSSYAKILGETNFHAREIPRSGWKAEGVERRKK